MSRAGTVLDHLLHVCATRHLSLDSTRIPRGVAVPVHGTPFDFTSPRRIGARIDEPHEQLRIGPRYDHTWVLDKAADAMSFAAELYERRSGRVARLGASHSAGACNPEAPASGVFYAPIASTS